jgi:hypothetical protein
MGGSVGKTYPHKAGNTSPKAIIWQLPPPPLMHNRALIRNPSHHVSRSRNKKTAVH